MNQVEVFEEIDAPPDVVWDVLLDFESYPSWNPFIRSIEGVPVPGEQLRIRIDPPESRAFTYKPEVLAVEENWRLVWMGRLGVPFAFDGYHEFHLEPIAEGSGTRLLQRETVRGALVPLLFDRDEIARGFRAMNRALKERAEAQIVA
ncbi:SRPBCC domain-containing protein [Halosolutus halophilus]|uniref:SRPBCC domain-containing protein n=1 Tax=Halosolutus halophilus TaxID=1552990 RepID=UPI0022350B17|nr:SRPBCC domain-containing protein [Halosolutus halophilus]